MRPSNLSKQQQEEIDNEDGLIFLVVGAGLLAFYISYGCAIWELVLLYGVA
jgi:hypothetical protein